MKSQLSFLIAVAVLFVVSSCATTEPLQQGELRLLRMDVPENGNLRMGHSYRFDFAFESDGSSEIIRAICNCADTGMRAYRAENIRYGAKRGNFNIYLFACTYDMQRWECYVDYVTEGKKRRSNSVFGLIYGR